MVTIRQTCPSDLPAIRALDETVFPGEAYDLIALRQFIDLFPSRFFVAEDEGAFAGYGLGAIDENGEGWVLSLAVAPDHQGKRVGARLLEAIMSALASSGTIRLTVVPDNAAARALYEKKGFAIEARKPDYYGPGLDRLIMARPAG